ncbi:MAG: omptin family outer membrane protease [Deltaproteobacteria bacterium]|nr:omptin family outer membrane protease [Deltaproteobacteria bacterium]
MKKGFIILMVALLMVGFSIASYAQGLQVDFSLGAGRLSGDTTYQIGGDISIAGGESGEVHFPISELEFPINVYMACADFKLVFSDSFEFTAGVKKSITEDAGKMKDSDWGYYWLEGLEGAEIDTLDVYSESDAELDALILEANLRYRLVVKPTWSIAVGLGYIRDNFDYDIKNIDQWYPSDSYYGLDLGHDYISGLGLTYEIKYDIPYVELSADATFKNFNMLLSLGYSPYVQAEDDDGHLLRRDPGPIFAEGECDGNAYLASLQGKYNFMKHFFMMLDLSYMKINTEGEQDNFVDGQWVWTTDEEIESEQIYIGLSLGYSF